MLFVDLEGIHDLPLASFSMFHELVWTFQEMEKGSLNYLVVCWAFTLGALIGSFLNVVIYRVPLGRSISLPPSACTTCNTPLHWSCNVPVFFRFDLQAVS